MKLTKQQKRDLKRNENLSERSGNKFNQNRSIVGKELIEGSSVYKRLPVYPEAISIKNVPNNRFIKPSDKSIFNNLLSTSYKGFELLEPSEFDGDPNAKNYSNRFQVALQELEKNRCYRFDITQPTGLGSKLAKTFVSRCLVGEAGITYKYLGLRMFAYPWNENVVGSKPFFVEIGHLNKILIDKTKHLLENYNNSSNHNKKSNQTQDSSNNNHDIFKYGSCDYNITLINRCFPIGTLKLKDEPLFEKDKISVSWHADSSLEHYSSIAVYHFTKPTKSSLNKSQNQTEGPTVLSKSNTNKCKDDSWQIAFKVQNNAEGPNAQKLKTLSSTSSVDNSSLSNVSNNQTTSSNLKTQIIPPIAVPLPSETTYFLLDEFNHHHQHAVLAGKTDRYSSTHRVSRTDGHTYNSIKQKCISTIQGSNQTAKQIRTDQLVLSELEFEWIRQYYVQGSSHHLSQEWWHEPMNNLIQLWTKLEHKTAVTVQALMDAAVIAQGFELSEIFPDVKDKALAKRDKRAKEVEVKSYEEMIEALTNRRSKRYGWRSRYEDEIWSKLTDEYRPLDIPFPLTSAWSIAPQKNSEISNIQDGLLFYKLSFTNQQSIESNSGNNNNNNNNNEQQYDPSTVEWIEKLDLVIEVLETMKIEFTNNNISSDHRNKTEVKKHKKLIGVNEDSITNANNITNTNSIIIKPNNETKKNKKKSDKILNKDCITDNDTDTAFSNNNNYDQDIDLTSLIRNINKVVKQQNKIEELQNNNPSYQDDHDLYLNTSANSNKNKINKKRKSLNFPRMDHNDDIDNKNHMSNKEKKKAKLNENKNKNIQIKTEKNNNLNLKRTIPVCSILNLNIPTYLKSTDK